MIGKNQRKSLKRKSKKRKNEGEGDLTNTSLPEELLEMIISKLPFPDIFKARVLSRSWLAKLSAISAQENEASRDRATSFHVLLGESSKNWRSFCAVWFIEEFYNPVQFHCFFGHDGISRRWRKLPSLSFLPDVDLKKTTLQVEGALLYGSDNWQEHNRQLLVANILTQTWKFLPEPLPDDFDFDPPRYAYEVQWRKLVIQTLPGELPGYKIITVGGYFNIGPRGYDYHSARIYDSYSNTWMNKKIISTEDVHVHFGFSTFAYVNGNLYMMEPFTASSPRDLLAFSIEEGTSKFYNLSHVNGISSTIVGSPITYLVASNTTLLLVLIEYETVRVFEVNLKPLTGLFEMTQLTQALLGPFEFREPVRVGDCLYFPGPVYQITVMGESRGYLHIFNVEMRKWNFLTVPLLLGDIYYTWKTTCFQPGLNPFIAV